jgi:methyl-accepting chemotaxis protein
MTRIDRWKVGTRLAAGFGFVLLTMALLAAAGIGSLERLGSMNAALLEQDWARADAAGTINVLTRENARQTMRLFIVPEPERPAILARIDANKKLITATLERLDGLIERPEAKAMLAAIRAARMQYVASFTEVQALLERGARTEAASLMNGETLGRLDALLDQVRDFSDLQKRTAMEGGAKVRDGIVNAIRLMLAAAVTGAVAGIAAAVVITRGLVRQLGGEPAYAAEIAGRIAGGDLSTGIRLRAGDRGSVLQAMASMRDSLGRLIGGIRTSSDAISAAAQQIAAGNADLSARTARQASSLEETAASMEELSATVSTNADNAREATVLVQAVSAAASCGDGVVQEVGATMARIHASSHRIAEILGVIDNIAFQTNILALNAAVEAARAGEQGRGFAVVATEVRQLAQRSAAAARDIKTLIGESVDNVDAGARLAGEARQAMQEITGGIARAAALMSDIASASSEQAQGIRQVTLEIGQLDGLTQRNAALVEEAAHAAQSLQEQAAALAEAAAVFRMDEEPPVAARPSTSARKPAEPSTRAGAANGSIVRLPAPAHAPVGGAARPAPGHLRAPEQGMTRRGR